MRKFETVKDFSNITYIIDLKCLKINRKFLIITLYVHSIVYFVYTVQCYG